MCRFRIDGASRLRCFHIQDRSQSSAKDLYLQQWPDAVPATFDSDFQKAFDDTEALVEPAADAVLDDPELVPPLIATVDQKTARPVPLIDASGAPEWYKLAMKEIGTHEEGDNSGPAIARYRRLAQCGNDHDPWCAIFANAMFALCNPVVPGTKLRRPNRFATTEIQPARRARTRRCCGVLAE